MPQFWTTTPLETLVDILDSQRVPLNNDEREKRIAGKEPEQLYPYYGATGQVGRIDDYLFDEPLILLGEDGVPFFDPLRHKAYQVEGKSWVNNHAHVLRALPMFVDRRYLSCYLNAFDYRGFVSGSTRLKLTQGSMRVIPVAIAPLNEQKRIADKLDAVLALVDACRERLDRVPDILKRFRQAVLAAATAGKLTEEWRAAKEGDSAVSEQPLRWGERPLVDLCEKGRVITYGVIKLGKDADDGVPCLRTSNVRWLRIDTDGMKRIATELSAEYARTVLRGGEVLVNVRGTLGGVAVVQSQMAGWNVSREVAVVPVDNRQMDPWFLAYWVGSEASQNWLGRVKKGVAYIGINIEDLRNLPIGIPHMDEQKEIVRRVQALFGYADRLEARYTSARAEVERLTPALLDKAFRGELVPQDPNDEPASVLLARFRAAQAAAPAKPRRGKTTRKAKMAKPTKESVKEIIARMPDDQFTFDDLRGYLAGDYESLKGIVFDLLAEPNPSLEQVFDKAAGALRFVRVKP